MFRGVYRCSYLHAKQIIHRDLKSNSIFFMYTSISEVAHIEGSRL